MHAVDVFGDGSCDCGVLLSDFASSSELARVLSGLLANPERMAKIAGNAQRFVADVIAWPSVARSYVDVIVNASTGGPSCSSSTGWDALI